MGEDSADDGAPSPAPARRFGPRAWALEVGRMALNALPVYCFNVSQFANNILSQAFIGHLGAKQLAASALAISYMNVCCQTINYGLATGQETVVSQANGARRFREVGVCLQRGLIVLFVSQFIMSCVSYFGEEILVGLGQDAALAKMAGEYIWLSVPTMWGAGYSTVVCTWLQAQGIFAPVVALGLPGLAVQVVGLKLALPRFGYLGATAATAASAWTSATLFTLYALYLERVVRSGDRRTFRPNPERPGVCGALAEAWDGVGAYLAVALPSFSMILFEWSALEVAVLYSGVLPESAGGVPTAVSAMVMGAITCAYAWSLALSQVASSRVGNTLGEGDGGAARFRAFCAWSLQLAFALACQAALYAHRRDWASVFASKSETEVFIAARRIYPVLAGILFCDANAALISGLVRGCGLQHIGGPLNLSAFYLVGVPLCTLFTFKFKWGLNGIWGGIGCAFLTQAVSLGALVSFADFDAISLRASRAAEDEGFSDDENEGRALSPEDLEAPLLLRDERRKPSGEHADTSAPASERVAIDGAPHSRRVSGSNLFRNASTNSLMRVSSSGSVSSMSRSLSRSVSRRARFGPRSPSNAPTFQGVAASPASRSGFQSAASFASSRWSGGGMSRDASAEDLLGGRR
jgi:MATE family multidrug resistance protein